MSHEPGGRILSGLSGNLRPQLRHGGKTGFGVPDVWGWGVDQVTLCFCSLKRNPDPDPQKQPNPNEASGLGQGPDSGLLVTHVNQTQDLLVKTAVSR